MKRFEWINCNRKYAAVQHANLSSSNCNKTNFDYFYNNCRAIMFMYAGISDFFCSIVFFCSIFFEINCRSHAITSKLNILILSINIQPLLIIQLSITTPTSHTPGHCNLVCCVWFECGGGVSGSRNSWSASDQTSSKSAPKDVFFELIFFISKQHVLSTKHISYHSETQNLQK